MQMHVPLPAPLKHTDADRYVCIGFLERLGRRSGPVDKIALA